RPDVVREQVFIALICPLPEARLRSVVQSAVEVFIHGDGRGLDRLAFVQTNQGAVEPVRRLFLCPGESFVVVPPLPCCVAAEKDTDQVLALATLFDLPRSAGFFSRLFAANFSSSILVCDSVSDIRFTSLSAMTSVHSDRTTH